MRPSVIGLVYIIFTLGSIGKPKGIIVEYREIVRLVKGSNIVYILL